ncbi:MAG: hypothetical protein RLZZ350_223 [Verrucomicrobiota bacterium]|jgi:hypothetical protein
MTRPFAKPVPHGDRRKNFSEKLVHKKISKRAWLKKFRRELKLFLPCRHRAVSPRVSSLQAKTVSLKDS